MALTDPIAVYEAANTTEADALRTALSTAGIEAYVTDDAAGEGGISVIGLPAEMDKPQVWIEKANLDRAQPIVAEFALLRAERNEAAVAEAEHPTIRPAVEVVCEECGQRTTFPGEQYGTVQECPNCGAYVDVGEPPCSPEWAETQQSEEASESEG